MLTRLIGVQLTTCRASSFATGTEQRSIEPSCWQPHAHSSRWLWPLIEAAAAHLWRGTEHRSAIWPPPTSPQFQAATAVTAPGTNARGQCIIPGRLSRPSSSIPRARRFTSPLWMTKIGAGRGDWSGRSITTETWTRRN